MIAGAQMMKPLNKQPTKLPIKQPIHPTERPIERFARGLYTVFAISCLPLLVGYLLWRSIRQPQYLAHWPERFLGIALGSAGISARRYFSGQQVDQTTGGTPEIFWIHAVSVGETRAAAPLIDQWLTEHPKRCVVLTHTTPTGRETGRALFAKWIRPADQAASPRLIQRYLPYDMPWSNAIFLSWAQPSMGVLMETELWPNLIAQSARAGVPLALVNARCSDRSARQLMNFSWLAQPALRSLTAIAAQTQSDADRLVAAMGVEMGGANQMPMGPLVRVVGNMKFDVTPSPEQQSQGAAWRQAWPHRHVWLAASTRDDEEHALLTQWVRARDAGQLADSLLVIVPRHPQRFDRVAKMIEQSGLAWTRRSSQTDLSDYPAVWLGDSLGEMFAYLSASDLVLMGGSLPALGGQNPIEACAVGKPVFFGPHMFNFQETARALVAQEVAEQVADVADWLERGQRLLANPAAWQQRSAAATDFSQAHRGAAQRTDQLLQASLQAAR
jgi:3-deoxy-D-manno-octulosonic-acid transferase